MELWRRVWRQIAAYLSAPALENLRHGLLIDDPRLVQGITCSPPAVDVFALELVVAADAIGYGAWNAGEKLTVHELHNHWENIRTLAELALGEPGIVRFFLEWFDECPRDVMRLELLGEVNRALDMRKVCA